MHAVACLVSARNLGDAVGHAQTLSTLARRGYAQRYIVWTKPESAFLFEQLPSCTVVASPFPLGTGQRFRLRDAWTLLLAMLRIRRQAPSVTLDLVGDFRDRWFARLLGAPRHLHIGWAGDHPFANLIRNPLGPGRPVVTVPATVPNVYAAYAMFVDALVGPEAASPPEAPRTRHAGPLQIGLHPFASQRCKLWPDRSWQDVAAALLTAGYAVIAFGAPGERARLEHLFASLAGRIVLSTEPIRAFDGAVADLDLMIGLDSFAVHMAYRHTVDSIMLNAGNPAVLWGPPGCTVIGDGGGCRRHPCYNVPRCEPGREFICVRGTRVDELLRAVDRRLPRANALAPVAHG